MAQPPLSNLRSSSLNLDKQLLVIGINQKIAIQLSAIHNNPLAQADENYGTPVCYSPQGNNFPETSSKTETYIITHYLLYHRICQITITKVGYYKIISAN